MNRKLKKKHKAKFNIINNILLRNGEIGLKNRIKKLELKIGKKILELTKVNNNIIKNV